MKEWLCSQVHSDLWSNRKTSITVLNKQHDIEGKHGFWWVDSKTIIWMEDENVWHKDSLAGQSKKRHFWHLKKQHITDLYYWLLAFLNALFQESPWFRIMDAPVPVKWLHGSLFGLRDGAGKRRCKFDATLLLYLWNLNICACEWAGRRQQFAFQRLTVSKHETAEKKRWILPKHF